MRSSLLSSSPYISCSDMHYFDILHVTSIGRRSDILRSENLSLTGCIKLMPEVLGSQEAEFLKPLGEKSSYAR